MVSAVVLAAGLSRRMGTFKLLLPWRGRTVIEQVVATLYASSVADVVVVTGYRAADVVQALAGAPARAVFNPTYADGEMLASIQAGIADLQTAGNTAAALICLGDQPQMEAATVQAILSAGAGSGWARAVIPSYQMRSGHPILLPRPLWPAVLAAHEPGEHLRAVLQAHRGQILYVEVGTPTILADLDTPQDYAREHPAHGN